MLELSTEYYFDLEHFQHADLFAENHYPWEVFEKIEPYLQSQQLGNIEIDIPSNVHLVNPEQISIGRGTIIEPTAFIRGPCIIGKNCEIRHGAYVRGSVITGDSCVIGHDTEIKHSVLLDGAQAAHFAYVGNSILGNSVNLGAGTRCANLKLSQQQIFVHFSGKKIPTNRRKFGAIIGDFSQLGCNSVTNPGTLMGKRSSCYPCTSFGGVILKNQIVMPPQKCVVIPN